MATPPEKLAYNLFPGRMALKHDSAGNPVLVTEPGIGYEHLPHRLQLIADTANGFRLVDIVPTKPADGTAPIPTDTMHLVVVSSSETRPMNDAEFAKYQATSGIRGFLNRLRGNI